MTSRDAKIAAMTVRAVAKARALEQQHLQVAVLAVQVRQNQQLLLVKHVLQHVVRLVLDHPLKVVAISV